MALAGETRWQSEGIRQESASRASQPAKDGGPGPVLPQSLTERQSFSVCSSWPGSIHSLCCLCSGLRRPGPSLQRLSQPSQTARHVNAGYGSERAGLISLYSIHSFRKPTRFLTLNRHSTAHGKVSGLSPPGGILHVRLELTHRQPQSCSPQGNKSS